MSDSHTKRPGPWAADHANDSAGAGRSLGISADSFVAALLRHASDAIAISDRDSGRFVVVSDSYCALSGYDRDELIGRTSVELGLVAGDAARSEALDGADRELGAIRELRMRRKGGEIRLFEFSVQLLAGGLMLTISRDITEQKHAAAALAEARNDIDQFFALSPDLMAVADAEGRFARVNPAWESVLGYTRDEVVGRPFIEFVHPDDLETTVARFATRVAGDAPGGYENRYVCKDGSYRWILWNSTPLQDGLRYTTGRDMTSRREAEGAVRESEERFRLLAENSTDVITRVSTDSIMRYVSPASQELYGYDPEEMVGHSAWDYINPEDHPALRQASSAVRLPSGHVHTVEYRARRRDGSSVWVESKVRTLWDPATGEPLGFHNTTRDISDRKHTEVELQRARQGAERANSAKSEFLSRMSHELRTPLNAILGFGQLLERAPLDERPHRHAEHVVKGGRHLLTLIDEVLEISRIESGNISISVEPLRLTRAAEDTVELIRPIADQRGIAIEADLSAVTDVYVMADPQRLKQVLLNLLSNAVKYNRPGGSIRVSAAENGETIVLDVSDTGPGIAAEDLPRVFTPFDRLGAEASDIEGTGLGLALSRGLAEAMGGSLDATSELGTGSTFELRLVRSEPQTPAPDRPASDSGKLRVPACRVLYVEDNVSNLRLVEEILADDDVEIIAACTGRIALDIAPGARADVILLDINLPDMTGGEVLRGLRAHPQTATTPVIVLTADATPATRGRMLELGASAHLTKPIDIDLLRATLADTTSVPISRPADGPRR